LFTVALVSETRRAPEGRDKTIPADNVPSLRLRAARRTDFPYGVIGQDLTEEQAITFVDGIGETGGQIADG
jgi:hypothetical protein